MGIIQDVLIYQTQMMRNSSLGAYVPPEFSPPEYIVVVNGLFYASLGVMLLAAFIAMLIKSWVREFDRGLQAMSMPEQRAKTREFRYLGIERWKLPEMVGILPSLIQISLFLFAIGLVLFLFYISIPSFCITTAIFGVGVLFHATTTSISVFVTSSPFHSPLSRTLGKVYQHVHAYFCQDINYFAFGFMDNIPETALGRVGRKIRIALLKSRPYLEANFVDPISATTEDEVQVSTAASALQRIHESAPDSQHSEALHWSVWQVAGSTTLSVPPLFNMPFWILGRWNDEQYLSHLPPAMLVTLVAVSLRVRRKRTKGRIATVRSILRHVDNSKEPWSRLVIAVLDLCLLPNDFWIYKNIEALRPTRTNDLINMITGKELQGDEAIWLLNTLSELYTRGWLTQEAPFLIEICFAILLDRAPKWNDIAFLDSVLLEAVVTLAAISCSPDEASRLSILTNSREHPWLLLNVRNPTLISTLFKGTPPDSHKRLISLLFLVVYALINRWSYPLAIQYITIITEMGDLPLYTSALTTVAPCIKDGGLFAISRMIVAPQTPELASRIDDILDDEEYDVPEELIKTYDQQLGAGEDPDPNIFAILLILSRRLPLVATVPLQDLLLELRNPWLRLAARVAAQRDIPDGYDVPMGLFHDHRVHNMIAALSLLRYTEGRVTEYTESLLLGSFLESREFAISSIALEFYMRTTISYSDPPAPSCHLTAAASAAFNFLLPDDQLPMGWVILNVFVDGFGQLSVEWRRMFAEGFFALSRQRLPKSRGDTESGAPYGGLERILTWEYFHREEQEPVFTDADFNGLDWMAMAWSLHLSQASGRNMKGPGQRNAELWARRAPAVTEEFMLRALCKLLDAAPTLPNYPNYSKASRVRSSGLTILSSLRTASDDLYAGR
jgi:hypothetical protein